MKLLFSMSCGSSVPPTEQSMDPPPDRPTDQSIVRAAIVTQVIQLCPEDPQLVLSFLEMSQPTASGSSPLAPKGGALPKGSSVATVRLAQRVEEALQRSLNKEPKQILPQKILVAPQNRNGAPPNVQHVHKTILQSFLTQGYDYSRPPVGICVEVKSVEGRRKLLEHNKKFISPLMPPLAEDAVLYGSIACTHLNTALRFLASGKPSPAGDLSGLVDQQPNLKEAVLVGHKWWVLPEDTEPDLLRDISNWRNTDQAENQTAHEMEILQLVATAARDLAKKSEFVAVRDIIAKASRQVALKQSQILIEILSKLYVSILASGASELVNELIEFHSQEVNPSEVSVSGKYFENLVKQGTWQTLPFLRHYLILAQFTTEESFSRSSGPQLAAFLDVKTIDSFLKTKLGEATKAEKVLKALREKYLASLAPAMSASMAQIEVARLGVAVVRTLFGKPVPRDFGLSSATGKWTDERIRAVELCWCYGIQNKVSVDLHIVPVEEAPQEAQEDLSRRVSASSVRALAPHSSECSEEPPAQSTSASSGELKCGDKVRVIRKMTWAVPHPERTEYMRDVPVGKEGTVQGFTDESKVKILLAVELDLAAGPQVITKPCFPRNVRLVEEAPGKPSSGEPPAKKPRTHPEAGEDALAVDSAGKEGRGKGPPGFLLGDSSAEDVRVHSDWRSLISDEDELAKTFLLKSRIGSCLDALSILVDHHSEEDFQVISRRNSKGAWNNEVWTLRDFKAKEILIAPVTSQLKGSHLTSGASALVGLPTHGAGKHPSGAPVALDGRGRNFLHRAGGPSTGEDTVEKKGSLYWIISRTDKKGEANLSEESSTFGTIFEISIAGKKKHIKWDAADMPAIPIMTNMKAIKKETLLKVFLAPREK